MKLRNNQSRPEKERRRSLRSAIHSARPPVNTFTWNQLWVGRLHVFQTTLQLRQQQDAHFVFLSFGCFHFLLIISPHLWITVSRGWTWWHNLCRACGVLVTLWCDVMFGNSSTYYNMHSLTHHHHHYSCPSRTSQTNTVSTQQLQHTSITAAVKMPLFKIEIYIFTYSSVKLYWNYSGRCHFYLMLLAGTGSGTETKTHDILQPWCTHIHYGLRAAT